MGTWCPVCSLKKRANSQRGTITECRDLARAKGGDCLSVTYINANTNLLWLCADGHEWEAAPSSIKKGRWCPYHSGKRVWAPGQTQNQARMDECHRLASDQGGECLSNNYPGYGAKLRWRCAKGHEWEAKRNKIQQGAWCPFCAGNNVWSPGKTEAEARLEEACSLARLKNGELLSKEYLGALVGHSWRCSEGHEWEATPSSIKKGGWCPFCYGRRYWSPGLTEVEGRLEECRGLARTRGGEFLSTTYLGTTTKHRWRCSDGHEWEAKPCDVKQGHWCPICSGWLTEEVCRQILGRLTGIPWPKVKPHWLLNDRGGRMELDGFCKALGVGFEYHGRQHYEFVPRFHDTEADFKLRVKDDTQKRELCLNHSVKLIEVPCTVEMDSLIPFLAEKLSEAVGKDFSLPQGLTIEAFGFDRGNLSELRQIARTKGGELLSETYLGSTIKRLWRCSRDHQWEATPYSIKEGSWCPFCSGRRYWSSEKSHAEVGLDGCRSLAKERGGECLSESYRGSETKLNWRCSKGHTWEAVPNNVKQGAWCPFCVGQRIWSPGMTEREGRLMECRSLAALRGGECLSDVYISGKSPIKWRCTEKHEWEAKPSEVRHGGWCPYCSGRLAWISGLTEVEARLVECQGLARDRGGECISNEYLGALVKHKWRCKEGHEWEMRPANIKNGQWCPTCGRVRSANAMRGSIQEYRSLAIAHGGKCLSETYVNSQTSLRWRCGEGHEWNSKPNEVKQGRWCPKCGVKRRADSHRASIGEFKNLARDRGGKCLSEVYVGSQSKLRWSCTQGHEWEATPNNVKRGGWCPFCAGKHVWAPGKTEAMSRLDECRQVARERGGKCLSEDYFNCGTKLRWRCDQGHEWQATPTNVRRGSWCPKCAGKQMLREP